MDSRSGRKTVNPAILSKEIDASLFSIFSIVRIDSPDDYDRLTDIHLTAYSTDSADRLMVSREKHVKAIAEMLDRTSTHRDTFVEAAKLGGQQRTKDEKLVGWIRGFVSQDQEFVKSPRGDTTLENRVQDAAMKIRKKYAPVERKHCYITNLVVDPLFRGKGIGTRLIKRVTDLADEWRVPCWVQSSPTAHELYKKRGFQDMDSLVVDLDDFRPRTQVWSFGLYGFHYMLREPRLDAPIHVTVNRGAVEKGEEVAGTEVSPARAMDTEDSPEQVVEPEESPGQAQESRESSVEVDLDDYSEQMVDSNGSSALLKALPYWPMS